MLEVIGITVQDCIDIEKAGADRIELVSAMSEGGLTPSIGMIEQCLKAVSIPIRVMIRPHSHSYYYSDYEIEAMKYDIEAIKSLGAKGVVFGVLNKEGKIYESVLEELIEVSDGMKITFHRAFDQLSDLEGGLDILLKYPQINTILTAGGKKDVVQHSNVLRKLVEKTNNHLEILVGGGVTIDNIDSLGLVTKATHFHIGSMARTNGIFNESIHLGNIQRLKEKI